MVGSEDVKFEVDDRVATITLNRPQVLNAISTKMFATLTEIWREVRDNPEIWVAIITGTGERAFSAGVDLKEENTSVAAAGQDNLWRIFQHRALEQIDDGIDLFKPIIAAVRGYCMGGGVTLLSVCDIRVAGHSATFALPEVRRGILPTLGATQRLPRQLPLPAAMELLLMGEPIDAERALQIGLINKVVDDQDVLAAAQDYAARFREIPPLTVRAIKEAVVRGQSMPIEEGMALEAVLGAATKMTEDFREGVAAFVEKRKPQFKAR